MVSNGKGVKIFILLVLVVVIGVASWWLIRQGYVLGNTENGHIVLTNQENTTVDATVSENPTEEQTIADIIEQPEQIMDSNLTAAEKARIEKELEKLVSLTDEENKN